MVDFWNMFAQAQEPPIDWAGKWWHNDSDFGAQYYDTGYFYILVTVLLCIFIIYNIKRAGANKNLFIRRIPGLNAIDEAVGRATEMGKPVLLVPGLSDPVNAIGVQAINICAHVARVASRFSNPILMCAYSASMYTLAQEVVRDVYQSEGIPESFDPDSVRFISDRQFAFAAGVSGIIHREQTAAAVFVGEFYAESLIFAETANSIGAIQVASSTEPTQTPFFIAACDYVLIGDEFYAASAYLSREPVLMGSLIGQDWSKMFAMGLIALGVLSNSSYTSGRYKTLAEQGPVTAVTPDTVDFSVPRLLTPVPFPADREVKREPKPSPSEAGGGQ